MAKIFIESKDSGTPESKFLESILKHIGILVPCEIVHTDGYTNLFNGANVQLMQSNVDEGGKNIVIFDADTASNNGGFNVRRQELLSKGQSLGLQFDLFLWPDNRSDGDVEVLMESIARKDLYPEFFDCFSKYECCMSRRKNDNGGQYYTTPNLKSKLHTYFHSLPISNTKKSKFGSGNWLWEDKNIWNLDADSLNPIKEFLLKQVL